DNYSEAAKSLKDLWSVHASIASVHLLMAQLPRIPGDTEDHLALARQLYARAIQGREELTEYAKFRWVVDGLKNAQTKAQ
ncbi:MAG: hypothetical protein FWC56_04225, partial [Phycisphaerae bacterium]|nr:hypothetical protein [Phycisphaerae bacterium]